MFICGVVLRDAFVFQRIFETLIISLDVFMMRWYSRLTRVLFYYNARVRPSIFQDRLLWSSEEELESETYFSYLYYSAAVIVVLTDCLDIDDCIMTYSDDDVLYI